MAKNKTRKKKLNSIIAPLESPKQVRREVNAAARMRKRGVAQNIRGSIRESREQSRNIRSWYGQHQKQIADITAQGVRQQGATDAQAIRQSQAAGQQDANNRRELQADENQSAAYRGVTPDSTAAARGVEAEAQRGNLRTIAGDRSTAQGQTNANFLGQIQASSRLGRDAMLRGERAVRQNARQDMGRLKKDTGDFKVTYRGNLRGKERDFYLQNKTLKGKDNYSEAMKYVADAGLAGKQASAGATIAAAKIYSGGKIKAAKIYGRGQGGKKITGADIKRAGSYLRSEVGDAPWQSVATRRQKMIDRLVNRGVDPVAAKMAVRRYITVNRKKDKSDKAKGKIGSPAWQKEKDKRSGKKGRK
jgi:hypothetical protein